MEKILVYNNRTGIADQLRHHLVAEQMNILVAENRDTLRELLTTEEFSVVLLDIKAGMKNRGEEMSLLMEVRQKSKISIIVVSEGTEELDQIMALDAGADDYVNAGENPLVILAKIKAQLRRFRQYSEYEKVPSNVLAIGELIINELNHTVIVEGRKVKLTPTEYNILKYLSEQPGTVHSNADIFEKIWKMTPINSDNVVAVHVRHIREKIETNPQEPKYLKVVWGSGYKIEGGAYADRQAKV